MALPFFRVQSRVYSVACTVGECCRDAALGMAEEDGVRVVESDVAAAKKVSEGIVELEFIRSLPRMFPPPPARRAEPPRLPEPRCA